MKEKLQNIMLEQAELALTASKTATTSVDFLNYVRATEIIYKQLVAEGEFREAAIKKEVIKGEVARDMLKQKEEKQ
jgi:hypothetical protein